MIVWRFSYLSSCVTMDGSTVKKMSRHIPKARAAYTGLRPLDCPLAILTESKGCVYCVAVRPVFLHIC